ncbi:MAG: SRPBCC domain-containing protein [Proteobacteria bacterium]|nr:SRPBCC domain-containing protein [Pseudomonadota bacterium]
MASDIVKAGTTVTMSRVFDAPRELVFEVWTNEKHFQAWWGPEGSDNGETHLDVHVGGEISVQMRGPGFDHPMGGEFLVIEPPSKLVFLSKAFKNADGDWQFVNRNTVTFEEAGKGRTRVTLHVVVQSASEEFQVPVSDMEKGWSGSLDRLHDLLAKLQG